MYLNRTLYCITDFLHKKTRITEQISRIKKPRTRQHGVKKGGRCVKQKLI